MAGQPVPDSHFACDIEKKKKSDHKKQRAPEHGSRVRQHETPGASGPRHFGKRLNQQCDDGERRDGVAEANPVSAKKIGGDERRGESTKSKEKVDQVQRRSTSGSRSRR